MSRDHDDARVVVVGAGPVGLLLAGQLCLAGASVVVLERLTAPAVESRASTLHARSMEILDCCGVRDRLGEVPREPRGHFGGIGLDLTLPVRHPGQWKVPQTRLEEVLGEWAVGLGARILRGHEVTGLTMTEDHVTLELQRHRPDGPDGSDGGTLLTIRAGWVVGCDGERSAVRRLGGFAFPGTGAGRELLRADVAGLDIPARRFERTPRGLLVAAPGPDGVTRVMVHEHEAAPLPGPVRFHDVVRAWWRVAGEDISAGTPLWVNAFGDACRQADRYRIGRLLLAGDAAHQQLPIGGQSLNLGLQDAFNLGWKLGAVACGRAPGDLLDSYHDERHPAGRQVQNDVRAQALLLLGGPEADAALQVLTELTGHEQVRTHLAGRIGGLTVHHGPDGVGRAPLGPRLPFADRATDPFAPLRSGHGVLVLQADRTRGLREAAGPWADRVRVVCATAEEPGAADAVALLVRPDGHVAWTDGDSGGHRDARPEGGCERGLRRALERWFGPGVPAGGRETRPVVMPVRKWGEGMGRLTGRTALVTGASRGIGRAAAIRLAAEGTLVAVHYAESKDAAGDVVAAIESDGGRAFAVRARLGVPGDVDELFGALEPALLDRTGRTDLDILVNNAGVMGGTDPATTTPADFDRLFAVNARAPFFLIQRALENMPDGGRIINVSSGLTRCANPGEIVYAMSKGALEQLALHFAKVLGPRGITVNSVAPGITRNDNPVFRDPGTVEQMAGLSAFGRIGEPEDVADVVAFLATDEARWITGSFVDATGGTLLG
ncbi:SDR family oxidoreductase [Streptomyces scabiei]|uniref:SDR family oxidoreductase n=1 Tax=Streptomyces scabiei TaxID=1930 RepID=UPI00298FA71B|nr:SDR family oxidoreductase [Streptomyces scabiei]MDW8805215.1 SDR family oxidoreductase [Streptomyces scabiei]